MKTRPPLWSQLCRRITRWVDRQPAVAAHRPHVIDTARISSPLTDAREIKQVLERWRGSLPKL